MPDLEIPMRMGENEAHGVTEAYEPAQPRPVYANTQAGLNARAEVPQLRGERQDKFFHICELLRASEPSDGLEHRNALLKEACRLLGVTTDAQ